MIILRRRLDPIARAFLQFRHWAFITLGCGSGAIKPLVEYRTMSLRETQEQRTAPKEKIKNAAAHDQK